MRGSFVKSRSFATQERHPGVKSAKPSNEERHRATPITRHGSRVQTLVISSMGRVTLLHILRPLDVALNT